MKPEGGRLGNAAKKHVTRLIAVIVPTKNVSNTLLVTMVGIKRKEKKIWPENIYDKMKVDGDEWLTLDNFVLAIKAVDTVIRFVGGDYPALSKEYMPTNSITMILEYRQHTKDR
jgi:hypothetical protein